MSNHNLRFAIVCSTGGSVMNEVLSNTFFRQCVQLVAVDRVCPAINHALSHAVPLRDLSSSQNNEEFCDRLLTILMEQDIDYVFSYYTRFYTKRLRNVYRDRIVNFHPSILPAFKGMDGFGDTIDYHAKFVGNTVEFIDQVMDEGKIIMQTACPFDTSVPLETIRHRLFVQQCQALLQVAKWLSEDRIVVDGRRVHIRDAVFGNSQFSPALDDREAQQFSVGMPAGMCITAVTD